jgi:hypothetical protein
MIRSIELKNIFRVQRSFTLCRSLSAEAKLATSDTNFQDEWNKAKPFDSIPTMNSFQLLRSFVPGGECKN